MSYYEVPRTFPLAGLSPRVLGLLEDPEIAGAAATQTLAKLLEGCQLLHSAQGPEFARLMMLALADPGQIEMSPHLREELEETSLEHRAVHGALLLIGLYRERVNLEALVFGPQPLQADPDLAADAGPRSSGRARVSTAGTDEAAERASSKSRARSSAKKRW